MIIKIVRAYQNEGYIAGMGDGIVSVGGVPASRQICLLELETLKWLKTCVSTPSGHYLFIGLDPRRKYVLICRDLAPDGNEQRYEPVCYDQVAPAEDLTIVQQLDLWQSWQV